MDGLWTGVRGRQKQSNDPGNNQHNPQYANYWAPLTRKRHIPPHPAQPQHTIHWAPRTRKLHQQEHRLQRTTRHSDPTQHAKGRLTARPTYPWVRVNPTLALEPLKQLNPLRVGCRQGAAPVLGLGILQRGFVCPG